MISKFRFLAFFSHLCISVVIALISLAIVFLVWYPNPLAKAIGATDMYLLMLGIDITLGPLLTLVIAKKGKKSLKFDLSVIAVIQIAALLYGMYTISLNRPSFIAFDNVRFETVQANDIVTDDRAEASFDTYRNENYLLPIYVAVKEPANDKERNERTFFELQTGIASSTLPSLYEPLENQWASIVQKGKSLSELEEFNHKSEVDTALAKYPEATSWLPLKAYEVSMVVLINDSEIVKIVDLRPW